MVEQDSINSSKQYKNKPTRPRPVFLWNIGEVQKWLRRHCSDYYPLYSDKFLKNEITGHALVRFNETTLTRMGIENGEHRKEIMREIMKLCLKSNIIEIRDLERKIKTNE